MDARRSSLFVPLLHSSTERNQDIQKATASEPLTLDEEYAMQQSWRKDNDKLTFIICRPLQNAQDCFRACDYDSSECMLGDINLFLDSTDDNQDTGVVGEVELMIARKELQGRSIGKGSLLAFLQYIVQHESDILDEYLSQESRLSGTPGSAHQLKYLRVKIGKENARSIGLFEKFGFRKVKEESNYFGEFELRLGGPLAPTVGALMQKFGVEEFREFAYDM